jgi:nucleoside-diphosphate-sugar epimerase
VYVEDLADGVVAALAPAAAGRVYNLVGDESVTVREIADTVRELVAEVPIVHVEGRAGDLHGAAISGERAARELGWRPETSFADGVAAYVDWLTAVAPTPRAATASRIDGSAAAVLRQEPGEL